jgi:two-component system CheB/CheR fusion protein
MVFIERMRARDSEAKLQIFATDIDQQSLETARNGIYPDSIAADVQPERLERFFTRYDEHSYQIEKAVRDVILFAPQNLLGNAPFSKLNLISCRNLLIYLEAEVQTKIIRLFHFALKESGFLLLGPSETVGRHSDMFETVSRKWRIYRRIGPVRRELVTMPISTGEKDRAPVAVRDTKRVPVSGYRDLMTQVIINSFSPACALISRNYEILSVQGPLVDYMEFPPGELSRDLLAMARKGLRTRIRAAVHSALRSQSVVIDHDARVMRNGNYVPCTVQVRPLSEPEAAEGLLLVAFSDRLDEAGNSTPPTESEEESSIIRQLEYELNNTREDLQSTIEEMESSNEELKASNEEVMSMNEELQSTNEELETSKEELQSLNEELSTVNSQLQDKVVELDKTNNDMINLLDSTDIATIFLDPDKRIKRFTPVTAGILSLIATDIGRPISDFSSRVIDENLLTDVDRVLHKLTPKEREVQTENGAWYLRRIVPYRTQDNHIEGVVINFIEITERKRFEAELRAFNESLEQQVEERSAEARLLSQVVEQSPVSVIITDADANIEYVNPAFERISGYSADEIRGENPRFLQSGDTRMEVFSDLWETLHAGKTWHGEFCNRRKNGEQYWDRGYIAPVLDASGELRHYVAQQEDITERKQVVKALEEREYRLRALVDHVAEAIITVDKENVILEFNPAAEKIFGYSAEEIRGKKVLQLLAHPSNGKLADGLLGDPGKWHEFIGKNKYGEGFPMELVFNQVDHLGFYAVLIHDISLRRRLEKEIIEAASMEQERIGHEIHDGIGQQLTGITMLTKSLIRKLELENSRAGVNAASELMNYLDQTAENVRKLSSGLSPINFTPDGLIPAIAELVRGMQTTSGLVCEFIHSGSINIIDEFKAIQIYRIVQEALNNAVKHASASRILVTVDRSDKGIVVSVEDDGKGIDSTWDQNQGLGMHIMHYRADIIGARLTVETLEGGGTRLSCHCHKSGSGSGRK